MKLIEPSKAVIFLCKKLRKGNVSFTENPKSVWESDPIIYGLQNEVFLAQVQKAEIRN